VDSWRAAYRDHLPAELLAGLSVDRRREQWEQLVGDSKSPTLVAEIARRIVGFVGVGPSRDEEGIAELYAIYLDPSQFGTGVGRALMDAALERMRGLGYREATLWVIDGNARAERFYRLAGWRREDATKVEEWADAKIHEVRYRRDLHS
jgi:ribosomal protein S18 acetylase RimI-like enzyme